MKKYFKKGRKWKIIKREMGKKKIEIIKIENRAENALFQGRDSPFSKYKNRAASPMTLNEGGAARAKRGKNIHPCYFILFYIFDIYYILYFL